MRLVNKSVFLFCVLALAFTACRKPEPGIVPNNDEPVVKKYLVKQLLNDEPERIMLAIDWSDDFTKILHVKYGLGSGSILDYGFTHFGNDSIRVSLSMPQFSYPMWCFWYDTLMIHLNENKIDSICCYANGELSDVEHYYYNEAGKLIERRYNGDYLSDTFEWVGEDVVEFKYYGMNNIFAIDSFTDCIYPQYTLPFYLASEVAFEIRQPLFSPFWKHQPVWKDNVTYEADEDGYLTKMVYDTSYWITYYYATPDANL